MKRTLYLGTDPTQFESDGHFCGHLIHYPVIKVIPRSFDHPEIKAAIDELDCFSHLLFTSKNAAKIFCTPELLPRLQKKQVIAIGAVTATHLKALNMTVHHVAKEQTQEGVIELLGTLRLENPYFFLPRSSLSRPTLVKFFEDNHIRYMACDLYDTVAQRLEPVPDLTEVDEIIFTSPSTVSAFLQIYGRIPKDKRCVAIGPITQHSLCALNR